MDNLKIDPTTSKENFSGDRQPEGARSSGPPVGDRVTPTEAPLEGEAADGSLYTGNAPSPIDDHRSGSGSRSSQT